ncbi:hypothetical protein SVI_0442 [Shewanella violacea DSS12]|uniref:Uncharacterized protein n=1 Tax=Shewanella violacea (strain JCM 10179 / CIP 106290 / LMG 19151 / DSS12) TaxID=637905 RepID=D4ZFG4_SHEVD|nr:hypothetical protein SVI_0442 [Shewanella violacea DSS12]
MIIGNTSPRNYDDKNFDLHCHIHFTDAAQNRYYVDLMSLFLTTLK